MTTAMVGGELTAREKRGKQIYFEGTSPRGEAIEAFIGVGRTRLPGMAATCASCHGSDGRGRPEAGVIPSDISWNYLMKAYGHAHPMGRSHPAFDEESLKSSIRNGQDSAGNGLDPSMPLYTISDADLDDLVAYMKRLESDFDPGLSETAIRIGTVVPSTGKMALLGRGILEVLTAYLDEVNSLGGIYNRRLELVRAPYDSATQTPLGAARRLAEQEEVFAIVSPFVAGADAEIGSLAEEEMIPVIGPVTLFSPAAYSLNDYTFHLFSGLQEQARALIGFAARELQLEAPRVALISPGGDRYSGVEKALQASCRELGWAAAASRHLSPERLDAEARRLQEAGTEVLFVLDPRQLYDLVRAAGRTGWRPYVFAPGAFARKEIFDLPPSFQKKVYLSYPTLPSDQSSAGISEFRELLERHGFAVRHRTSQVSALASAKIFVEGLKGAGRQLSRQKFLRAMERIYQFETGLTPTITFGANRRIGAVGAYVVAVDLEKKSFLPMGGWISVE